MILVTGATGHFGTATIDFLLKKGVPASNIAGLVRDEAKAKSLQEKGIIIKKGDYDNYDSLLTAFTGIDKLLLVSGNDIPNRSRQQANAVKAAKQAGVKHIIYTSFERKNESETSPIAFVAQSHLNTEKLIKESGIPFTILRNNLYMDYIPLYIGDKATDTGIFWPAGEGKLAAVTRSDMAEAAANILTSDGHANKEYAISHTENVDFTQVAKQLSAIAGKNVTYTSPDIAAYKDVVTKAGVPAVYVDVFAGFAEAIKQGEFETSKSDMEKLLGRKPTTLEEYLPTVYAPEKDLA